MVHESDFKVCFDLEFHKRLLYSTSIVKFNTPFALTSNKNSYKDKNFLKLEFEDFFFFFFFF
jgi:hypothetical protein